MFRELSSGTAKLSPTNVCLLVADREAFISASTYRMINRTPRALLKGASSILAEGGSLTSNGVEYEVSEAKDAIKGFVHIKDDRLKNDFQNSKIQNEKENISAATGKLDEINKAVNAKKTMTTESKIPVTITKGKISLQSSSWSAFAETHVEPKGLRRLVAFVSKANLLH